MLIRQVYDECLAQAAYLIGCQVTGEAIVIDPERDVDRYVRLARENGLRLVAAAETHIHADFLSGTRQLAESYGTRVYLSGEGGEDWSYRWPNAPRADGPYDVTILRGGDHFSIGNVAIEARHTPGHTPEHLCFLVTDTGIGATEPLGIVSGDFVFVGDVGRPDLLETAAGVVGAKDGAARELAASASAILELEDYLQLWPGHGAGSACGKALGSVRQSTLGYEKRVNPALRLAGTPGFIDFVLADQPSPPLYFGRMKRENRDGPPLLDRLPAPPMVAPAELGAEVVIVDTRPTKNFAAGHLPGSISAPFGAPLPAVVGSYVEPGEPVALVVSPDRAEEAARVLARIGLDDVVATIEPRALRSVALEKLGQVDADTLADTLDETVVLDVRTPDDHAKGLIAGARNVPYTRLREHTETLPRDRRIVAYCETGSRSTFAASFLVREGFDAANVRGGVAAWVASGRSLVAPLGTRNPA